MMSTARLTCLSHSKLTVLECQNKHHMLMLRPLMRHIGMLEISPTGGW